MLFVKRHCRSKLFLLFSFTCLLLVAFTGTAQETIISGKVTDAGSGDPIPFANLLLKGTSIGVTTDFDGNYLIKTKTPSDSLLAS